MLTPIGDDNSGRRNLPIVTYVFIGVNVLVFIFLQGIGNNLEFTYAFSIVPQEILTGTDLVTAARTFRDENTGQTFTVPGLQPTPISVYITFITSMFMHGGIAHLAGNMVFLWIFGDNVEDRMGRGRFITFYVLTGIAAALAHIVATAMFGGDMQIPMLGASGAISGVLGGYLLLFPTNNVRVLVLRAMVNVPAYVAIGMWFAFQIINGLGLLGGSGGVAYGAHIGGFIAGLVLVKLFDRG